jgi:hypothetical protein
MKLRLAARREVWWPTPLGWLCLAMLFGGPPLLWWWQGENYLSLTQRAPAEVLIVECWIGPEGVQAAGREFVQNHYQVLVATGGLNGERWNEKRWSYVEMSTTALLPLHLSGDQLIQALAADTERQRTYEMAVAARRALAARGLRPKSVNVLTRGPHARRSRLIFARVFGADTRVGVISWAPVGYAQERWWHSSTRALEFLKESVGLVFEALFHSGRRTDTADHLA